MEKITKSPYWNGYDAGLNGSNEINSHFSIFSTPENTKEWERGKIEGESLKQPKFIDMKTGKEFEGGLY